MAEYAMLRRLTSSTKGDIGDTFTRMAVSLKNSNDIGRIQFQIIGAESPMFWNLSLHLGGCDVSTQRLTRPDLEIITSDTVWRQIASGKLSPLVAFVRRRMRVRGDYHLGKRILKQLSDGKTDICC
jgi:hypothetical protein